MLGHSSVNCQPMFWSQTQMYHIQNSLTTTLPQSDEISPFHFVNIQDRKSIITNQTQERSFHSSVIQKQANTKRNQLYVLYEETKPKDYREKPFVKIREFRPDQLQIIMPIKSHRTEFTYIDKIDYTSLTNRSHFEQDQQLGARKKKMTVVSKSIISSPKVN